MAKFCSLYSSSSGNCTFIGAAGGGILIDIGVSAKRAETALAEIGVDPSQVAAIFVTHEHNDHISGVRVFAKRHGIDVYASAGTLAGMEALRAIDPKTRTHVLPAEGAEVGGFFVRPFRTPHDARESTGFSVTAPDGRRLAVATDIGCVTQTVMDAVAGSDLVLLESNHDLRMLQNGPYPYFLKERILSDRGHLCNDRCAETAVKLLESGTTRFVLGHLSRENNLPALARETTRAELQIAGAQEGTDYLLQVAGDCNPAIGL
ncbi:MAG: MBL fold metallo-hydrolase [Clostridia bacterium]|nr:MBL fold metallo-hydrolase [Clostridia bacterium]